MKRRIENSETGGWTDGNGPVFTGNPEAWLAAIVESSEDAIIGKTLDSVIRSWNRGARRIFQYEAGEIIGRSVLELIPPELRGEEVMIVERLSRGERIDHFETVRMRRDGRRIDVSLSVSPIRDTSGGIVGAAKIARDVTEQHRLLQAERELAGQLQQAAEDLAGKLAESRSLHEGLERANLELAHSLADAEASRADAELARREAEDANSAKTRFLATMSHELRTPLNAIAGYVDLLEMGIRGPITTEQRRDLARIKRSQESLLRLIDEVLGFAKIESGRLEYDFEDVLLNDLLVHLETFVGPRIDQKRLRYSLEPCADGIVLRIDRAKVQQILLNLLSNAVKFTDAGVIVVGCRADHERVRIYVRDTGCGVRAELLEAIFEPFVQGDRSLSRASEGTGLGLSISRQLARGMGGDVVAESILGKGSTFSLILPRAHG